SGCAVSRAPIAASVNSLSKNAFSHPLIASRHSFPGARILPWHTRPAASQFQYGANINGVSGLGRLFSAKARTESSDPHTLNTSAGCGKTLPFSVRPSPESLKNIARHCCLVHQTSISGVRTRTLGGRISRGTLRPSPFASCFRKSMVRASPASRYGGPLSGESLGSCIVANNCWPSEYTRMALESPKLELEPKCADLVMISSPRFHGLLPNPEPNSARAARRGACPERHPNSRMPSACFPVLSHRTESAARAPVSAPASIAARRRSTLRWHPPTGRSPAERELEDCNRKTVRGQAPGSPEALPCRIPA